MNFGTILNSMTKHCVKLVMEGKEDSSKSLATKFIRHINVKRGLKTQFKVYHSLNTSYVKNHEDARLFVTETINTLRPYTFEDIKLYNALLETKFTPPKIKSTKLNSHIANLIKFTTTEFSDVHSYVESLNYVTEHVKQLKEETNILNEVNNTLANSSLKFLEPKHVIRIAIKKFNKDYTNQMNENDRKIFNILKTNDSDKIKSLYDQQNSELQEQYNQLNNIDNELQNKIKESIKILNNECTSKNILNAYELLEELRSLNK